ncbi:hypothetical protein [Caulobacter sp. S45]|jgi:hypothetical protein|uniref:hypothetical protein n=1 Tax=Caulobacter sp. S45 TaxID=1641861 RepID=UPI00131E8CC2|nr:hypothetical protein [Caulobacter sp. S45]
MDIPEYGPAELLHEIELAYDDMAPLSSEMSISIVDANDQPLVVILSSDAMRQIGAFLEAAKLQFPKIFQVQ